MIRQAILPNMGFLLLALLASAGSMTGQPHTPVISSFDNGADGWTWTTGVTWQSGGGNPGGYLKFVDYGPAHGGQIIAPSRYLGNWSSMDSSGEIRFDFRIFATSHPVFPSGTPKISGPGGSAYWTGAPVWTAPTSWLTYAVPIHASVWKVTSGTWSALLANVTELRILMPASSNASETTGVDNIVLRRNSSPTVGMFQSASKGVLVTNTCLIPGNEYFNIFSTEPCPGGPGNGPYLGLCASNPAVLINQFMLPVGAVPFHFTATNGSAVFGPFPVPPTTIESVCFEITGGKLGPVSKVIRYVVQ